VYYQHFGLNGPPFQFTPSPSMVYMSQTHREGMAALEWGLMHESSGFSLLAGESGTGKTTLIASLLSRQYQRLHLAYVTNPRLDFPDVLRLILTQLGVEAAGLSKGQMLDALGGFLGGLRPAERVAIIFDEAQGLSDEALEDLRLLSNYGRPGESQLQLILAGQPELLRRLMAPQLRQFNERIGARTLLVPLDATETKEYIDYRLRAKGGSAGRIFHPKALKYIVAASAGVPRRVNVLCHNAMLLAYAAGAKQVTLKMAKEAVAEYQDLFTAAIKASSNENPTPRNGFRMWWNLGFTTVAAVIACLVIALMAIGPRLNKWNHRASATEAGGVHDQTLVLPQSALMSHEGAENSSSSRTPIAVPDYIGAAEEPAAAASPSISAANTKPKRSAVRLAKQHSNEEDDEGE
jgi:type II secretory pathway predicted ATPase ExeA